MHISNVLLDFFAIIAPPNRLTVVNAILAIDLRTEILGPVADCVCEAC